VPVEPKPTFTIKKKPKKVTLGSRGVGEEEEAASHVVGGECQSTCLADDPKRDSGRSLFHEPEPSRAPVLMEDMAYISGLVAADVSFPPLPLPYAPVCSRSIARMFLPLFPLLKAELCPP